MMKKLWFRSVGMAAAFGLLAASAHAGDALFAPFETSGQTRQALKLDLSFQALANNPATASLEVVHANANLVGLKTASLDLNLGRGLELRAHRVNSYVMNTGSLVWAGIIEDPGSAVPFSADTVGFDPHNTVMLVKSGKTITGNVHFNGEWYKIRPLKTGGHAIVAVDHSAMPPDHPKEYAKLKTVRMPEGNPLDKVDTVIRVMVHYTSSAASASGNISALVDLAVAESNTGYTNSGVLIDLILAHKSQVSYTQSGSFSTDLSRYRLHGQHPHHPQLGRGGCGPPGDQQQQLLRPRLEHRLHRQHRVRRRSLGLHHRLLLVRPRDRPSAVGPSRPRE
jgi:peptidyl-Asp metalloendopeptidase